MTDCARQRTEVDGTWEPLCGDQICFAVTKLGYVNLRPLSHAGDTRDV